MAEVTNQPNAPAVQTAKTSGKTFTVYCKLPHGITYDLPDGRRVRLQGMYGDVRSPLQVSGLPGRDSVLGFGVTRNIDAEDWEQIVKDHGKSLAIVNGLVFAKADDKSGTAAARERENEKTGLEPYDPTAHTEDKSDDGLPKDRK